MYKSLFLFLVLFSGRILQLFQLYFTKAPSGGYLTENHFKSFLCATTIEVSTFAGIAFLFSLILFKKFKRWHSFFYSFFSVLGILYLLLSGVNDQVFRWMGQHFDLSFITTYTISNLEPELVRKIMLDGLTSFILSLFIVFLTSFCLFFIPRKITFKKDSLPSNCILSFILLCMLMLSNTTIHWNKSCRIRWKQIQPIIVTWYYDINYQINSKSKLKNYAMGIQELGGNINSEYPFYHYAANEDSSLKEFKSKPLKERPDIILLSLESLRGWATDFRIDENCKRMPNLCTLSKSGSLFPYTYSVGYPSTEGMTGLQLGIWSHPQKTFLTDFISANSRALPEILGDAGYYRLFLTAAEPSFDNFTPWFNKWADYHEYRKENNADIPLAHRFVELYKNRPKDKPLYSIWINFTTHTPFTIPKSYDTPAKTADERYKQALSYLDSALGIIFKAIQEDERYNETILVITGDHSIANNASQKASNRNGNAFTGITWTMMSWSGYKIPKEKLFLQPISHVNFAPTILSLLNLSVSNHFVGKSLFSDNQNHSKVYSFRRGGIAMRQDSIICFTDLDLNYPSLYKRHNQFVDWDSTNTIEGFYSEPDYEFVNELDSLDKRARSAAQSWKYVLDKNKLYLPK